MVHERYLLIKNKTTGVDPLVDEILSDGDEHQPVKVLYGKAKAIYLSSIKRSYVEACLLASEDLAKISEIIGIPVSTLELYRTVFYDIQGLDKLSLLEVVDGVEDSEEKGMKIWALSQGLDFVAWRLGKQVNINPVEGLQELFTLAVFKSKEALFSGNASEGSKEATKWAKLSMDLARLLKAWILDSSAARSDIELALMSVIPDFKGFDSLDDNI